MTFSKEQWLPKLGSLSRVCFLVLCQSLFYESMKDKHVFTKEALKLAMGEKENLGGEHQLCIGWEWGPEVMVLTLPLISHVTWASR